MQIWNTVCNAETSFVISEYAGDKLTYWLMEEVDAQKTIDFVEETLDFLSFETKFDSLANLNLKILTRTMK